MAVRVGRDRLGRRYKTVNGRHVKVVENASGVKGHATAKRVKDSIDSILRHWTKGAKGKEAIQTAISQMLSSPFGHFMNTEAKTAVGRFGRLYASLRILNELRASTIDPEELIKDNDLDTEHFAGILKQHGIVATPPSDNESPGNVATVDDDAEILRIVHNAGLNAQRLRVIISASAHDSNR